MITRLSVSLLLGITVLSVGSQANAGWGSYGGSGGSWGGSSGSYGSHGSWGSHASLSTYGSSGGSWGGSTGYASSGGSWNSSGGSSGGYEGPLRRLVNHIHAKHAVRHAYRHAYNSSGGSWGGSHGGASSGGSWGGSSGGSSGGSWNGSSGGSGSWGGSSGGSTGSWTVDNCDGCSVGASGEASESGDYIIEGAPSPEAEMESEPIPSAKPDEARRNIRKGILTVQVPANAEVTVNGLTTTSAGELRRYVSHGLKPGQSYRYEVRATVERDGKPVQLVKTAVLRAGQVASLGFDFDDATNTQTSLTLNVPEDAKVYLSGTPTRATGSVRRFSTNRIADGQLWSDYVVRVDVERDGQTLTKERRVTLSGGDQAELKFDFDQTELADAR